MSLENDIRNSKIRFPQSYNCARNSYKKVFLGYSQIMNIHKETDKLITELDNLYMNGNANGIVEFNIKDREIGRARFNCLMIYYSYKHNKKSIENKRDLQKENYETSQRLVKYEIVHGMFYKYMFKAIEKVNLKIIFYCNGIGKLLLFQNIIKENKYKELFDYKIVRKMCNKNDIQIVFKNGSLIEFSNGGESARGYKHHYAIVDTTINREIYDCVIKPTQIDYWENGKTQELKDTYRIEFMDLDC